jgi:hypothetical protein
LNGRPQSLPKTPDSSLAVLPEAGQVTSTALARIDLNGAFAYPSQLSLPSCCDGRLNSPNMPLNPIASLWRNID